MPLLLSLQGDSEGEVHSVRVRAEQSVLFVDYLVPFLSHTDKIFIWSFARDASSLANPAYTAATPSHISVSGQDRSAIAVLSHLLLISLFHLSPNSQHPKHTNHSSSSTSFYPGLSVHTPKMLWQRCCSPCLVSFTLTIRAEAVSDTTRQGRFGERQKNKKGGRTGKW